MHKTAIAQFTNLARNLLSQTFHNDEESYAFFFRMIAAYYIKKNPIGISDDADSFSCHCQHLHTVLPQIFEPYTVDSKKEDLYHILSDAADAIPNADWEHIEIIGWLHQAYHTADKDAAFALLKKGSKIPKSHLPAATQLFTPDWIVRYLVQNSLGKLWLQIRPNSKLRDSFDLYLPSAATPNEGLRLEQLRVLDPCMGSGHILVYAFELLYRMYLESGYLPEQAVKYIFENNLYGLDIDPQVTKIACFSLMMKAYRCDPQIFQKPHRPQIFALSDALPQTASDVLRTFREEAAAYGSLVIPPQVDTTEPFYQKLLCILRKKYHAVITNPPYMGKKSLNEALSGYLTKHYPPGKSDLYAAFLLRCSEWTAQNGFTAMITIHSWMFIHSYAALRERLFASMRVDTLLHTGASTFEELNAFNVLSAAFCLQKSQQETYGRYVRLCDVLSREEKLAAFSDPQNHYCVSPKRFTKIPGHPLVYHISDTAVDNFDKMQPLSVLYKPKQGIATADNAQFVRYWFEVPKENICFDAKDADAAQKSGCRWFPYNKGGNYRKWYGMNEYVIDWEQDGKRIRNSSHAVLRNMKDQFKSGITWSLFGFENFGVRYKPAGFMFDVSGSSLFVSEQDLFYTLAFLASKAAFHYLSILAPTVNFQVGNIAQLPFAIIPDIKERVELLAKECIRISKEEWDDYETSWDFHIHPLMRFEGADLNEAFEKWEAYAKRRYDKFTAAEQEIHRLFIQAYGLEQDLDDTIPPRDIAIKKADRIRDAHAFLSYAVGCMFGRYDCGIPDFSCSLLTPNEMTKKLIELLIFRFGQEHLSDNLRFLADTVGKSKTSTERLTAYFADKFFTDHCRRYQKHPIYFKVTDREKDGFTAYFYLHSYRDEHLPNILQLAKAHNTAPEFIHKLTALTENPPQIDPNDGVKICYRKLSDILEKLR